MSRVKVARIAFVIVLVSASVMCLDVLAQGAKKVGAGALEPKHPAAGEAKGGSGKGDSDKVLRVRKFLGSGKAIMERSPEYQSSVARGGKQSGEWAQITLSYDTDPDWIDELTFQYFVMTETVEGGKKAYSFFKNTFRYLEIEKGRGHVSAVYLRPNTIKRYGAVVASAVEISYKGEVIATEMANEPSMGRLEAKWWTKPETVENNPNVTVRDGYLLERAQTPFAFINIDDYEVSK